METVVYKAASEKIQDGCQRTHPGESGVMFESANLPMPVPTSEIPEKLNSKEEFNENKETQKSDGNNAMNVTDALSQKSLSPTLIEHAFKVVKNIFSPDKNRSRSSGVLTSVSQQRCSSRSPRNSVFLTGKSEYSSSDLNLSNPSDTNLKGDIINTDETGVLLATCDQDSHNNTNDSFLTTVSLIEESFQSAVTHFEDNGDIINGDLDALNSSRNLDLLDPSNETLCGSECGLDSTMLKNASFGSVEGKLQNKSDGSEEGALKSSPVDGSHAVEEYLLPVIESQIGKNDAGSSCKPPDVETLGVDIQMASALCAPEEVVETSGENVLSPENDQQSKLAEIIKIADASFNKPIDDGLNTSATNPNETESNMGRYKATADYLNHPKSMTNLTSNETFDSESTKTAETNISTTTIVLSESNSDFLHDALSSLTLTEDNENAPPGFSTTIVDGISSPRTYNEISPFKTSKAANNANISKNTDSEDKIVKKGSRSGGSTPNKHAKGNRNKLNKSMGSITRKNLYNSPKGRKTLRQNYPEDILLGMEHASDSQESTKTFPFTPEKVQPLKSQQVSEQSSQSPEKADFPPEFQNNSTVPSLLHDSNSLSSQQSYTILNTSDSNLKRPVITSSQDLDVNPSECTYKSSLDTATGDLSNRCQNTSTGLANTTPLPNQISTPELCPKDTSPAEDKLSETISPTLSYEKVQASISGRVPVPELEFSPVVPLDGELFHFAHSVEKQLISSSPHRIPLLRKDHKDSGQNQDAMADPTASPKMNQTFDKNTTSGSKNLNETFDLRPETQEFFQGNDTFEISKEPRPSSAINTTFDIKTCSQGFTKLNQTFDKITANHGQPTKMNETFDLQSDTSAPGKTNTTFDITSTSPKMDETFDLKPSASQPHPKINETFDKNPDQFNQTFCLVEDSPMASQFNQTFDKPLETGSEEKPLRDPVLELKPSLDEKFIQPKQCPTTILEPNFLNPDVSENFSSSRECLNSSFISTTSSNTSLLCNGNVTVLINQGSSGNTRILSDQGPTSKDDEPVLDAEVEEWSDTFTRPPSADEVTNKDNEFLDANENPFIREEKLPCDSDLVQFIQEQFTTTDIEKICSVVEDFSMSKPSSQKEKGKTPATPTVTKDPEDPLPKLVNPLSPHSFDFLSSIGGNPSGRDWSRESLYVKFDPLVQGPVANSLIDFTKEVEALEASGSSPANETVLEHLLTISPQKKADEIVPPLTPFSHKSKNLAREDKTEKLKDLQNEIYFLKNLYAERERINKGKMDEYESQITKLTGQTCILEEKLKESSERERSLVRKLQDQNQSLHQLKTIMEEYVKVITELTSELEKVKKENANQLATLTSEKEAYVTHLQNTEAAFTDVHAKYEKSKKTIIGLKTNEAMFRQTLADQMRKMEEYKEKAREAQERACKEIQKLQEEHNGAKASHSQETARLRALLRKTELKLEAMQESLDQKIKENHQLTAICDELIEGKK